MFRWLVLVAVVAAAGVGLAAMGGCGKSKRGGNNACQVCQSDRDCPDGNGCVPYIENQALCTPIEMLQSGLKCTSDSECSPGYCNGISCQCFPDYVNRGCKACTSTSECGGLACFEGHCVPADSAGNQAKCTHDDFCGKGHKCDLATGACDCGGGVVIKPGKEHDVGVSSYQEVKRLAAGGSATARFAYATSGGFTISVTSISSACVFKEYSGSPASYAFDSGGTVTFSKNGAAPFATLSPKADNTYDGFYDIRGPLFASGDSLAVSAAGGPSLPAFSGTLSAPAAGTITAPAAPAGIGGRITIAQAADLQLTWTGGGAGKLHLVMNSGDGKGQVDCSFDAAAGSGVVPAAALSRLVAGANASISLGFVASAPLTAGGETVNFSVSTSALKPDGTLWMTSGVDLKSSGACTAPSVMPGMQGFAFTGAPGTCLGLSTLDSSTTLAENVLEFTGGATSASVYRDVVGGSQAVVYVPVPAGAQSGSMTFKTCAPATAQLTFTALTGTAPVVTSFSPTTYSKAAGGTITIQGSGFAAADGVIFASGTSSNITAASNKSDTSVTASASSLMLGTYLVMVKSPAGVSCPAPTVLTVTN